MGTRVATVLTRGSASAAAEAISKGFAGDKPAFAMIFASTAQPLTELMPQLAVKVPGTVLLAASTAGEFTEKGDAKGAVSAVAVTGDFKVHAGMGHGLKADPVKAVDQAIASIPAEVKGYPHRTILMLLDPLSGRGEEATLIAATKLGEGVRLAGGAAGDDLKMASTHVALGERVAGDAVVMAAVFSKTALGVGVHHGHQSISRPMKVTRASGSTVFEIDGRPAWDVWAERTREVALKNGQDPAQLEPEEVGGFLLRYEAGLANGQALKIRAPLSKDANGAIHFATGIPQGAEIQITEGLPEGQIASACEAARRAHAQIGKKPVAGAIVFDCICRNLILGDRFAQAVETIRAELGGAPLAGFETYGEIALDAGDMSGFHNTTTVVLCLPKD